MKKSIFVIAVAVLAIASCNKELTCECTITDKKGVVKKNTYTETGSGPWLKKWCKNLSQGLVLNDTISKAECKLQ